MKFRNFIALLSILSPFAMQASEIGVTTSIGGELEKKVANPKEVTFLAISGPIDAQDMLFIGKQMLSLKELDISEATITEVKGTTIGGRSNYDANAIPAGAFAGLPLKVVEFPAEGSITIGDGAFMNTAFTKLNLPANIDSIGQGAFAGCADLTEVVFPTAKRIGSAIFEDCTALVTVDLNGATTIPEATFRGCSALTTVTGSEQLAAICDRAFEGTTGLKTFAFGNALQQLGVEAFAGSGLDEVALGESDKLTSISNRAFAGSSVSNIRLGENVTHIGEGALMGASKLKVLNLPSSVITLGSHALVGTSLTDTVTLPCSLEEIGDFALLGQNKVERITLPASLIYIGNNAMEGMTGLAHIQAGALTAVPALGQNVWEGVNQPEVMLTVDDELANDFSNADQWKEFKIDLASARDETLMDETSEGYVRGRFVGTDLQIESSGMDIVSVRVYDAAGRLTSSVDTRSQSVTVDTSNLAGGVFVVNVTLDDNNTATLKLGRK